MAEHPILFTGEMVRAIQDGRKTQTRRVVKPQPHGKGPGGAPVPIVAAYPIGTAWDFQSADGATQAVVTCPYSVPGDTLWVRECWKATLAKTGIRPIVKGCYRASPGVFNGLLFEDDVLPPLRQLDGKWRPSIHMPRWASRITLEVTGVRVERVQEISATDVEAEGIDVVAKLPLILPRGADADGLATMIARQLFQTLWDSINVKRGYGWEINPWVWVVEFVRQKPKGGD